MTGTRLTIAALVLALAVGTGFTFAAGTPAHADGGGCPNQRAATGADHADARSAHGPEKWADRGCSDGAPPPEPTPDPADGADVSVQVVSVRAPDDAVVGEELAVRVSATLLNMGPEDSVLVDTTFVFTAPAGCAASPPGAVVVEDTTLPEGASVGVSRTWLVVCSQADDHTFNADVSVAIDPGEGLADPDPTNNSASDSDTTSVAS